MERSPPYHRRFLFYTRQLTTDLQPHELSNIGLFKSSNSLAIIIHNTTDCVFPQTVPSSASLCAQLSTFGCGWHSYIKMYTPRTSGESNKHKKLLAFSLENYHFRTPAFKTSLTASTSYTHHRASHKHIAPLQHSNTQLTQLLDLTRSHTM